MNIVTHLRLPGLFIMLLLSTALHSFAQVRATSKLKFLTYNILQGMRLDSAAGKPVFTDWIKTQDPDILALQEVTGFTQTTLEEMAAAYEHPYAVLLIEGEKYPVAITSKYPITNVQKVHDSMDRGMIQAAILGYTVGVLHLTPFDYRKARQEIELVLAQVKSSPSPDKWILMGDFNSLSPLDSANYRDGRMVQTLKNYEMNYPPRQKLHKGMLDYGVISRVLASGFLDAQRLVSDVFVKTVHPKAFEPKTGPDVSSRIDFIFVSSDLKKKVKDCRVIVDSFTDKYSDHYPVILELSTTK